MYDWFPMSPLKYRLNNLNLKGYLEVHGFICGEYINGGFSGYTRKIAVAVQVLAKIPAALQTGSDQKNIFLCAAIWVFDQIFW